MVSKKSSYSRVKNAFKPLPEDQLPFIKKYAEIGKVLMDNLQDYFLFGEIDKELAPEHKLNAKALIDYFEKNEYKIINVEQPIDENEDWSGFIDVIAKNKDGKNILFEIKIRKDDKVELDTVIQAEFYVSMINIDIYDYKILHLIRSNYEVVECKVTTEQKFTAQEIIRKIKEIKTLWKK